MQYLIIFSLIFSVFAAKCPVYRCPSSPFIDNQCASYTKVEDQVIREVQKCQEGYTCPYQNTNKISLCIKKAYEAVEGEKCKTNKECGSQICDNDVCTGKKKGELCDYHPACGTGFSCINKVCDIKRKEGERCGVDEHCENHLGCTFFGYCKPYFSMEIGETAYNPLLCKSFNINQEGVCIESELKEEQLECRDNQEFCKYTTWDDVNKIDLQERCECSRAPGNKRYCQLPSKHELSYELIEIIKGILQRNKNKHVMKRFHPTYEEQKRINFINLFPRYKDVEECVIDVDIDFEKEQSFLH